MQKNWLKFAACAAVLSLGGAAQASVVSLIDDGFTDGTNTTDYRSVGAVTIDYTASNAQSAAFSFELFGARSVDGRNGWDDLYSVVLNGTTVFEGAFNLGGGGTNDVTENPNVFTYTVSDFGYFNGGKVVVSGFVDLLAGLNQFTFSFTSPGQNNGGNQGKDDESWGVNDAAINVAAVPLPAALPLLAISLAGLGALGLRRRKARAV